MYRLCSQIQPLKALSAALMLSFLVSSYALPALSCTIESSACYPWRIESDEKNTTLLEIVPNNAPTSVIYRVCLCPPAKKVSLIFDFQSKQVTIGAVEAKSGTPICRDFRIATARKSRLLLSRPDGVEGVVDGCYVTQ